MIKLLLILEALFALLLGLIVFFNNPNSKLHRLYMFVSISSGLWLVSNTFAVANSGSVSLLWGRLITPASLMTTLSLFFFLRHMFDVKTFKPYILWLLLVPNILIIAISPTYLNAYLDSEGSLQVGVLYPAYVGLVLINTFFVLTVLFGRKTLLNDIRKNAQLTYMRYAFVLAAIPAVVFGALLPLFGYSRLSDASPLFASIFLFLTALAIVRHSLFDIRAVVARSFAYALTLILLGTIYITIVFGVANSLIDGTTLKFSQQAFYVLFTLFAALSFQPVKRFFDKVTNKLFYRDYYEPQDVLDKLSDLLVGTVDVKKIEEFSKRILSTALRPSFFEYLLANGNQNKETETPLLLKQLLHFNKDVIVTDELETFSELSLKELLQQKSAALAIRLKTSHDNLGFMLLGFKQSGGIYTERDKRTLGIAADEIAVGLQNALRFEEIQRFNITLQQKIEEATKELRRVNHRLRELDKTKDEFISMASHQLRTPLTTIKGYLSMILDGDAGAVKKNQEELIKKAFGGAQKMVYLIGDMLNVSRLQTGKFVIDNHPTNLADLVEGEVAQLQETAQARNLKLIYHKPAKFPTLNLDETKIRQVVMNFIDNAIFYTPAGGSVTVELTNTENEAQFKVTDTGIGIPASVQHRLFSKFYRADNARKIRPDGTGLGLFMAKKVITAQGGAIIFKSAEGKGSTFGFSFPRHTLEVKDKPSPEKPTSQSSERKPVTQKEPVTT